jgi:hypothetical protein
MTIVAGQRGAVEGGQLALVLRLLFVVFLVVVCCFWL